MYVNFNYHYTHCLHFYTKSRLSTSLLLLITTYLIQYIQRRRACVAHGKARTHTYATAAVCKHTLMHRHVLQHTHTHTHSRRCTRVRHASSLATRHAAPVVRSATPPASLWQCIGVELCQTIPFKFVCLLLTLHAYLMLTYFYLNILCVLLWF